MDEKIKSFVDYENGIPHKKSLRSTLVVNLAFGLPIAFLGKGSKFTTVLILPMALIFFIWCIYLFVKTDEKRKQFYLYMGLVSIYESIIYLLLSYKIASLVFNVSLFVIILVIFLYILFQVFNYFYNTRIIKKGYYLKHKVGMGSIFGVSSAVLGMLIGKSFIATTSNNTCILITASAILVLVPIFGGMSINVLKYKYICQLEQEGLLQEN